MCGINGFSFEDRRLIKKMNKAIAHRGPDKSDIYLDKGVSLGHNRLSIIDVSVRGKQPITDESGRYHLVYNGEVYNYKEIKKELGNVKYKGASDSEVLVNAYAKWGENCLKKIRGIFAFCIYDDKKKEMFFARDHMGVKPLYYYWDGKTFVFSSEIKAILEHDIPKKLNKQMLNRYLARRYCYGNETMWENIFQIPAGHYATYAKKKFSIHRYWDVTFGQRKTDLKTEEKQLISKLQASVKEQLVSDVPLGVFLSGGLDSSAITALMRKNDSEANIETHSISFEDGKDVNENVYANEVAQVCNTNHHEYVIGPECVKDIKDIVFALDQPMADPALFPLHFLSKNATKKLTVVLTGDGADELFVGYDQHRIMRMINKVKYMPTFPLHVAKKTIEVYPTIFDSFIKTASRFGPTGFDKLGQSIRAARKSDAFAYDEVVSIFNDRERANLLTKNYFRVLDRKDTHQYFKHKGINTNLAHHDQKSLLTDSYLVKTDRMTMFSHLEARVPFLDHTFVDYVNHLPNSMKSFKSSTKFLLRKALHSHKLLPRDIIDRRKQTFDMPIDRWMVSGMKNEFSQYLEPDTSLLNKPYVDVIKQKFKSSPLYYGRQLWNIMVLQMWWEQWGSMQD